MKYIGLMLLTGLLSCASSHTDKNIYASSFLYDSSKPEITTHGQFIYDSRLPPLYASQFLVDDKIDEKGE